MIFSIVLSELGYAVPMPRKAATPKHLPVPPVEAVAAAPAQPVPPSPAVLKLQEQVVELVSQRHQARAFLNESHNAYLLAQAKFQAAETELRSIEQEVQYRIGLIAQLENRQPANVIPFNAQPAMTGVVTSEPALQQGQQNQAQRKFAEGSADELRREMRSSMM